MSTICTEQQHKLLPSHLLLSSKKLPFKDLEIPPRKQLLLSKKTHQEASQDMSSYETTSLHKYLPRNDCVMGSKKLPSDNDEDDDDLDPFSADQFRMYEFKVRRCNRSRSHDWIDCPFAHPGEKARRRDPRKYHYSGVVCPEFRRGGCSRGDSCEFAHGVFECWLHPSRYRTEACKDGKNCKRKVCFFAHTSRQLRIPADPPCGGRKYNKSCLMSSPCRNSFNQGHCCCLVCHAVSSPTSTLLGLSHLSPPLSPSLSPPLSPLKQRSLSGFSPVSRFPERMLRSGSGAVSYKDVLTELMSSLEAMNFNEAAVSSPMSGFMTGRNKINSRWIDTSFGDDQQQQFILSTSAPSRSGSGNSFDGNFSRKVSNLEEKMLDENGNSNGGFASLNPDIGWVNDLLM